MRERKPIRLPEWDPIPDVVRPSTRRVVGADVFIESNLSPRELGVSLEAMVASTPLRLKLISNRGMSVFPGTELLIDCVDSWRCRFVMRDGDAAMDDAALLGLLEKIGATHRWGHVEKLHEIDGEAGYTKAQGEE